MSRRPEDGEVNYFCKTKNGVTWGIKIKLKHSGPCEECLVKATCKEVCEHAWDFHLGKIAKHKTFGDGPSIIEQFNPMWDKRI